MTVTVLTQIIDAMAEKIGTLEGLTDSTITKYIFHLNNAKKGKYVIGLVPLSIIPEEVTPLSSYQEFKIALHVAYSRNNETVQEGYIEMLSKLTLLYNAFHHKKLGDLVSSAIAEIDFTREISEINLGIAYATIELRFKRFTSEV